MTPIVLVHGFMGGSAQWSRLGSVLSQVTEVIALDLPGFGENAHLSPINRIESFADWVIEETHARGLQSYHLLGHSMGGMIVQEVARRDTGRVNRLVLYATGSIGVLPGRFETIAESKRRAAQDGAETTARRIAATWFLEETDSPEYPACADIAALARLDALEAGLDAMEAWNGADALSAITQKTLVIWGDQDRTYAWPQIEKLWSEIPNATLAVIPGCAHAVHLEKPLLFEPPLLDFLFSES